MLRMGLLRLEYSLQELAMPKLKERRLWRRDQRQAVALRVERRDRPELEVARGWRKGLVEQEMVLFGEDRQKDLLMAEVVEELRIRLQEGPSEA